MRIDPGGSFGSLESGRGGEMFISILEGCGNLFVGSRVDYVEELGEDGLQAKFGASWVRPCGALLMEIVREDDLLSARKSQSTRNGQGCGGAAMSPRRACSYRPRRQSHPFTGSPTPFYSRNVACWPMVGRRHHSSIPSPSEKS